MPLGPKPPVPGLLKVLSEWATDSTTWSILWHFLKSTTAPWAAGDVAAILTEIASSYNSHLMSLFGPATSNTTNVATDLTSDVGIELSDAGAGVGTASKTSPVPVSNVLRLTWESPLRYRGGRPGINFSGLDNTDRLTGDVRMWSTGIRTSMIGAVEDVIADMNSTTLPSGLTCVTSWVSYITHGAYRTLGPLVLPINPVGGVQCQQRICSRRKRLGKGVPGE